MYDGMEILSTPPAKLRFGKDLRLLEVRVAATPVHSTFKCDFPVSLCVIAYFTKKHDNIPTSVCCSQASPQTYRMTDESSLPVNGSAGNPWDTLHKDCSGIPTLA